MTETKQIKEIKNNKLDQFNSKLTKIQGILTSNLRSRTSTDVPYMAFVRIKDCIDCENTKTLCQALTPKHRTCEECANAKCQDCEIPVIFRTKTKGTGLLYKPDLKKGDRVILEGEFSPSKDSNRPSFTAYSYQIL